MAATPATRAAARPGMKKVEAADVSEVDDAEAAEEEEVEEDETLMALTQVLLAQRVSKSVW
jgi:hypothetical protein